MLKLVNYNSHEAISAPFSETYTGFDLYRATPDSLDETV